MIKRIRQALLIKPSYLKPSQDNLEIIGVFNPGAIRVKNSIYILMRVAERPAEKRKGFFSSPGAENGSIKIDWFKVPEDGAKDIRCYTMPDKTMRLTFISHLRLARLDSSGFTVMEIDEKPSIFPAEHYEEFGLEDPRITEIEGNYYITCVACSKSLGVCTALIKTEDFCNFQRMGVIFPAENKDVVLLPEKINNSYVAYHRPAGEHLLGNLTMQISFSPDLIHWGKHNILLSTRKGFWDDYKLGAGPPPIKTEHGWLTIYHGVYRQEGETVGTYCAGAALFALNNPGKLIGRTKDPIIIPEEPWEKEGFVPDVIFPAGAVMDEYGKHIILYSGASDTYVTAIKLSLEDIIKDCQ